MAGDVAFRLEWTVPSCISITITDSFAMVASQIVCLLLKKISSNPSTILICVVLRVWVYLADRHCSHQLGCYQSNRLSIRSRLDGG